MKDNVFLENWINDPYSNTGSIISLFDPANISIEGSYFVNNFGVLGTCIYYEETNRNSNFYLRNNIFKSNQARVAGAGLFLQDNFDKIFPKIDNVFSGNIADFCEDYCSKAFRLKMLSNPKKNPFFIDHIQTSLNVTPGITNINFTFQIMDYFGQSMRGYNGSFVILSLQNYKDFSNRFDSSFGIDGVITTTVLNGKINSLK